MFYICLAFYYLKECHIIFKKLAVRRKKLIRVSEKRFLWSIDPHIGEAESGCHGLGTVLPGLLGGS